MNEPRAATEVTVSGGERFVVEGSPQEAEKRIVAAARGSIMELVWFTEAASGYPLALNPDHVVAVRTAPSREEAPHEP
jgi:uncharacterized protein YlzI (FlbEa/FlbD family)